MKSGIFGIGSLSTLMDKTIEDLCCEENDSLLILVQLFTTEAMVQIPMHCVKFEIGSLLFDLVSSLMLSIVVVFKLFEPGTLISL